METPLEKVSVKSCYAHSRLGVPIEEWQTLQDHCKAVAYVRYHAELPDQSCVKVTGGSD